ncbi:MAG: glycine zipper 2TM domain-containing protein [Xanthomonadales bacterium]|nr:glycine zipper 2TM domain-containing protein [Xanthomonadales bacterium]
MLKRILLTGAAMLLVASCAPVQQVQARGNYYERGCEDCGRVIRIESIGQRSNHLGGGTVLGAIVGGALGNQVGKGDGRKAATIVGALAGGAVGHDIEKDRRGSRSYYRIVVRMDRGGRTYSYEQADDYRLRRGDRVYIDNGYVVPAR